jgi:hypothetical protein
MRPPEGMEVDHQDGDGLNNRRSNLRICTHQNNSRNMRRHRDSASRFKGVSWWKTRQIWRAYIVVDNKQKGLGYYNNDTDAARAYDAAAKKLFGEFANLNFHDDDTYDGHRGRCSGVNRSLRVYCVCGSTWTGVGVSKGGFDDDRQKWQIIHSGEGHARCDKLTANYARQNAKRRRDRRIAKEKMEQGYFDFAEM